MARVTDDLGDQYVFVVFVWCSKEVFVRRFVFLAMASPAGLKWYILGDWVMV
jgi:hypothetical protein